MHFTQYVFFLYSILLVYISVRPSVCQSVLPSIHTFVYLSSSLFLYVAFVCFLGFFALKRKTILFCVCLFLIIYEQNLKLCSLYQEEKKVLNKTLLFLLLLTTSCSFNIMLLINAAVFSVLFF